MFTQVDAPGLRTAPEWRSRPTRLCWDHGPEL